MSRLFAVTKSLDEIVAHFTVDMAPALEVPSETVEGTPGLIVLEKDGLRLLKSIPWGFPRQTRDMRREGEPPSRIGLVADLTNPLWDRIVVHLICHWPRKGSTDDGVWRPRIRRKHLHLWNLRAPTFGMGVKDRELRCFFKSPVSVR
ncbi:MULTISPECIES: hypothetical protein [Rhizobium]|uniref:Uncharacterized protein n=1 Tax=Rhizobium favelukesii TaxID=348824 RepID=W6RHI6_9HYPH|nr:MULTISPECIES: hypothetical protein [Rhizobium]MCS0463491.1 hypothetical protein [Rhizobium favelukesii]UFS84664.1 hypothetical protein LPB79_32855 [Rhizobium sp. T136]CDM60274.1 hypothetical protein LPU83_pLPU83b_0285 [Rhizobium favelukesii]